MCKIHDFAWTLNQILLLSIFYREETTGTKKSKNSPRLTQQVYDRIETQTRKSDSRASPLTTAMHCFSGTIWQVFLMTY